MMTLTNRDKNIENNGNDTEGNNSDVWPSPTRHHNTKFSVISSPTKH